MIKRSIIKEIQNHLENKEITLLVGARQVGKTTLMQMLRQDLDQKGERTLFLSLDFEKDKPFFLSQSAFIKKIELEVGKKKGYVFIDEIQRKENAGLFLKGLYDMALPYKFVVSGSGSLELKEKIHESLAGRKRFFEIMPISFEEFIGFKTAYQYQEKLTDFLNIETEKTLVLLDEYLGFGGYPRVVLEDTFVEKMRIMDDIFQSYVERDIVSLLRIEKSDLFISLMKVLSSQIGKLTHFSEISNTIGLSLLTLKKYVSYAEKTFTLVRVSPYYRNLRKEITKSPMIYFCDLGLRNYLMGIFGHVFSQNELGILFQNFIFNILQSRLRHTATTLHFWRTKDGAEVDFVVNKGFEIIPIEVKYQEFRKPYVSRSMRYLIRKYKPRIFLVVNKSFKEELNIEETKVLFLPFWELFSYEF